VVILPKSERKVEKTYILNEQQIALKLKRMALEIAEQNIGTPHIILAGVMPNGPIITGQLAAALAPFFDGKISEITVTLNKRQPDHVALSHTPQFEQAVLVLVDDVANSGKTLTYALKPFLQFHPAKIQTAVLVDRTHKKFPIHCDFVGFSLATTIQDYIEVEEAHGILTSAWVG
jgi:pyrimidine operon attenuation protein/uracil phosphoribosyltransferase